MFARLRKYWKPEVYHGRHAETPFFEGWYFKMVDSMTSRPVAIIPGIILNGGREHSHAFIQVLDGASGKSHYFRFPTDEFSASQDYLDIRIGKNYFSEKGMEIELTSGKMTVRGQLTFSERWPWPVSLFSPGIMGWYAFVPGMECFHGVISMNHHLDGWLDIDGEHIGYQNGYGYMEKDWGRSFPQAYIWMQSNHFGYENTSITLSIATIPWRGSSFRGFLAGFLFEGRLYRFATYLSTRLTRLEVNENLIYVEFESKKNILKVETDFTPANPGGVLLAPYEGKMAPRLSESLTSRINVKLYNKKSRELLFSGAGECAGIETNGNPGDLLLPNA